MSSSAKAALEASTQANNSAQHAFDLAEKLAANTGTIILCGKGGPRRLFDIFQLIYQKHGKRTFFYEAYDADKLVANNVDVDTEDVLVVFMSASGKTAEVVHAFNHVEGKKCQKVVFTLSAEAPTPPSYHTILADDAVDGFASLWSLCLVFLLRFIEVKTQQSLFLDLVSSCNKLPAVYSNIKRIHQERIFEISSNAMFGKMTFIAEDELAILSDLMCLFDIEEKLQVEARTLDSRFYFHTSVERHSPEQRYVIIHDGIDRSPQIAAIIRFLDGVGGTYEVVDSSGFRTDGIHDSCRNAFLPLIMFAITRLFTDGIAQALRIKKRDVKQLTFMKKFEHYG